MSDCNSITLPFSSLEPRAIVADFRGGRLTTDSGALLLRQVAEQTGLCGALDAAISDPRDPRFIVHPQRALIAQRITAIALGYEDLNDHQALRDDPILQLVAGKVPEPDAPLASPPTLCRLENRIDRRTLGRIAEVLVDQFLAAHPTPPEHLILDFDATDDRIHGQQEGRFFHGYYDHHCYLPLYVFCGDELLTAYLRPSNIDAAKHSRAVLKLLVGKLRAAWPGVRITIRADSGFCRWRLMRWCDSRGIGYVLGLAKNPALLRAAADEIARAERQFLSAGEPQRVFGSFGYAAGTWDRPRRVIVKAERNAQGPNPRFIVANVPGDPRELYEGVYCQRGEMENRIKEQQLDLFADRTSCHRFLANQFRLLLSSAAYVLVQALRRTALAGTALAEAQVGTIRLRLLKVASRVVVSARRVVFHLASSYPYRDIFREVYERLTGRPPAAAVDGT
ncbi:Transposase DDE domain protein [Aquisphaera giovannonii]|uniref:Transposase DDE domain protein n=1 Tax=Aquisphaera giovannonii TaxID=406548 RepID=A0A5B9VYK3_9BACT|nr:IS1380 family transposase [Aquisphaera giovannonii]QEH33077.1 Transposase DDE domain protein [Aquisphaera giovannonii]